MLNWRNLTVVLFMSTLWAGCAETSNISSASSEDDALEQAGDIGATEPDLTDSRQSSSGKLTDASSQGDLSDADLDTDPQERIESEDTGVLSVGNDTENPGENEEETEDILAETDPTDIVEGALPDSFEEMNDSNGNVDVTPDAVSVYEPPPEWWGDPIATKPNEWAWVDFPESKCADGSPTGLGINQSPGATRALIYFEGGGACWNYATCFGVVQTSFHLSGYDEASFKGLIAEFYKNSLLLNRDKKNNPLADAHLIFLPYCTGDAFLGTQTTMLDGPLFFEGEIHFWGRNNVKAYLERLAPTLKDVDHIVISGGSAGGFGAGFSWGLFQEAFPGIRVDVLDDSGPPLNPADGQWEAWKEAWAPEFPDDCPECEDGVDALLNYFRTRLLDSGKFGLMSYKKDGIISTFFGLLPFQFEERLMELCALLDEEPDAQYFVVPGLLHTLTIVGSDNIDAADGTPLWWWISQMVNDDPEWTSHKP